MRRLLCGVLVVMASLVFVPSALATVAFGLESVSISAINPNGTPDVQAGSHPYAFTTSFTLNPSPTGSNQIQTLEERQATLKDVRVELPPGFVGNPNATPLCGAQDFFNNTCPPDTAVGYAQTILKPNGRAHTESNAEPYTAVYNVQPPPGVPAAFAYKVDNIVTTYLNVTVRTGGDYGLTVNVRDIPPAAEVEAATVKIWGVPEEASHNSLRGRCLKELSTSGLPVAEPESWGVCPVNVPLIPLLTNPTSCGVPRAANIEVDSWEHQGEFVSMPASLPELSGCERLDFSPSIDVTTDGVGGSTPTGLNVDVHVPQESTVNPVGLAEADVKNTTVALPAGVQLSPSAADGLLACSPAELGLHSAEPAACPDASKIGNVEIKTPLLPEPLLGSVYLASPQNFSGMPPENPFGSLLAIYIVAEDKIAGVLVKVADQVTPDPVTGQLVTTFDETPQLPFSDLILQFFGTSRAPLTTPQLCGSYTTQASFSPWTGTPAVNPSSTFPITSGPAGAPCSDPAPFAPGFQAGSTNLQAGAFTPFTLTMTRPDGDQTLSRVEMQMPPGLLGSLANVKLCPEPQAAEGTCGEESLIGHTVVSVGLGNDPFTVTGGKVYITTAYGGGQYGLSIVNPAAAGPFVLEEGRPVIVRASINVDPHTAALTIKSSPLPTILDGIPLQIQRVNVTVERPGGAPFTFNPTNCTKTAINGTLSSSSGAAAVVSTSFQVTNCANLAFQPKFAVSTSGKTSRANGASLAVKLTYPTGPYDANIHLVKVDLPKQLPSRLTTLQKACTAAQFESNPAGCPAASIVGHAKATTPVLPVSLEGPAYFVSHGGEAFPSLIIVLQGYGTTVDLIGTTFISKAGITSSTFKEVPDVPVGTFELTLPEGKYSALAANGNLCTSKLAMPTAFIGQNGAEIHESTKITVTSCPKAKKTAKRKKAKTKKGKKKS
jgi:hypothetical protein